MVKISVLIPSYNHALYIKKTIESILNQTHQDIEIVIVDDGSTDNSNQIIASVNDSRINHIILTENVGACEAMNIGIRNCNSDFIAVCNSDDIWEKNKLEKQLLLLQSMPEVAAVFSDVTWINEDGSILSEKNLPSFYNIFNQYNRSRYKWQKDLIEAGNCLCHPSVLIRSKIYKEVGNYNNYLRQLPDLHMWLKLLQRYDIFIMNEKLVKFRIHPENTSKQDNINKSRTWCEHRLIINDYFRNISHNEFYNVFGFIDIKSIVEKQIETKFNKEKILYLLSAENSFSSIYKDLALELLFEASNEGDMSIIDALTFQKLSAGHPMIENNNSEVNIPLIKKRKKIRIFRYVLGSKIYDYFRNKNIKRLEKRRMKKLAI